MKGEENSRGFATKAIHAGQDPAKWSSRAVIPPIFTSTTYAQIEPGKLYPDGFEYSRGGNPTCKATEECIAALENGKYGLIFSSGLAALSAITHILPTNSHILSNDDIYGGSNRLFRLLKKTCNVKTTYFDSDLDNVESLIKENTKMLYIESPTNPLLKVCDIEKLSKIAKSHNLIFAVDSTFATPVNQKPLDLGADIVYHSGSKFLNGHTDVIMGICVTNDDDIYQKLRFNQYAIGSVSSPFDCYLMNRGLKTLKLRMLQHNKNAMTVAQFLENHPNVESVNYPGLKSHKSYEISKKQMNGFGGVVSFYLKGDLQTSKKFIAKLKIFTLAESLGGYESLVEHPEIMTHSSVPPAEREKLKISNNFIRLSVGLEEIEDLISDIKFSLDNIDIK